jgi:hypothetical protein
MRVLLTDGKTVVTLKHFRYSARHRELLRLIQCEVENLELLAVGPNGPCVIAAFRLNLDSEELRLLNPSEAA